jgi:site-specific recombinase XerD
MKLRKFKGKWVVDFKLPRTIIQMYGVKRFRKVYDKKATADKVWGIVNEGIALNDQSGKIGKLLNAVKDEEGVGYTVQSFYQKWMDEYVSPQLEATTATRYALSFTTILEFCGDIPLPDITKATLHEYVAWRRKQTTKTRKKGEQISKSTVNKDIIACKGMFTFAYETGVLKVNPLAGYAALKVKKIGFRLPTESQFRTLVDACAEYDGALSALVAVWGEIGPRRSESLDLQWSDFDKPNRRFMLDLGKGKDVRNLPLSDYAFEKVDGLVRFENQPYIFCHQSGRKQGKRWKSPDKIFRKIRRQLDMDFVTPHVLRHLTGTTWLRMGADLKSVKEKLGQKDIKTTMIYVEYNESLADQAIRGAIENRRKAQETEFEKSEVGGGKGEDLEPSENQEPVSPLGGAPGRTRTCGPRFRKPLLYPPELQAHKG